MASATSACRRPKRAAEALARASIGKGAFRRFKDTLLAYPAERERWFAFSNARQHEQALDWLRSEGITPV